jgi:hypothetical protein
MKKYFIMALLALMAAGKAKAQTDTARADTTKTIQWTDFKDALGGVLYFEAEATNKDSRTLFAPLLFIDEKITFSGKYELSATTTQMIHNFFNPSKVDITQFDLYVGGKVKTGAGDFGAKVGNMNLISYAQKFASTLPAGEHFIANAYLSSGHYIPKAVVLTYSGAAGNAAIGYSEKDPAKPGFAFDGTNSQFIAMYEKQFGKKFSAAGLVETNGADIDGNVYLQYNPTENHSVMLNGLNLGSRPAVIGIYKFDAKKVSLCISGIWQQNGVAGGTVNLCFPFGGYINVGGFANDPRRAANADGDPNPDAKKFMPRIGVGYFYKFNLRGK